MELVSSSRSVLPRCGGGGGVAAAPSRTASASSRRKGTSGFVCALGCDGEGKKSVAEGTVRRRTALALLLASPAMSVAFSPAHGKTKSRNPYDERRLLQQNKKIQEANRAPDDFPNFIREGFEVKVVTSDNYITRDSGLLYEDIKVGTGNSPKDGQQVIFHYVGYNESGRRIDSTYIQGSPAKIRLGNKTLVPGKHDTAGFEEGIRDMKPGGKRRIIIPPELGPPVGPSTFFSAKQFEVFDIELLTVQDCQRRTIAFYSDVVCS
uniref:peptidylprolyl isomerase n=1 Tax=Oryza meridionalis TaxID=40149 RepID=A0A0E0DE14_9ORYZ